MLTLNEHLKDGEELSVLHVPTSLNEIKLDYLKAVTADVKLAPHYALVACIIRATIGTRFCATKKKDLASGLFMLVDKNDVNNVCSAEPGEIIISAATDVLRGYDVPSPKNVLSDTNVFREICKADSLIKGRNTNPYIDITNKYYDIPVYTISFKIIPLSDIHGAYDKNIVINESAKDEYFHP